MSFDQWSKVNLVDCLDKLIDYRGKTPEKSEKGILTLSAKSVKNSNIDYSEAYTISEDEYKKFMVRGIPVKGDILITTEAPMGQVAKLDRDGVAVAQRLLTLRPNPKILDNDYLLYYLQSPIGQAELKARESGSTVTGIKQAEFRKINIILPPLSEQKVIANILSSLDDKIELNNKINKNLEELAQTLYKRWFVDFDFPNEEGESYKSSGGEMVESELGLIPKGWKVESIGRSSISKLISSGINEFNGTKKYIATADVTNLSIRSFVTEIDFKKRPSRANMQPIAGSLWFAKMKDSRKMIRVSKSSSYLIDKCIFSTGFAGLFAPKYSNYIWTILTTKDFDDTKNNLCNGTTMQAINNENINRIRILIPDNKTLDLFESVSEPIFEKIQFNEIESNKLSKIRDELLPKLMNGEIEVPIEE
ncbi:restriction endonuclease subunit S [Acholeplasma laidlawii]|uniref:restriction endonuclease subunit S n=1 Tax=Acholeplasma laidlawii TaxID=2148 RepID=UPI000B988327|nr:restriction endonuclease subunit S [Acholeplasma laidlawii]PII03659.1 restriction endonuclease subunit S [Acholeplasma laidlawii]